MSGAGETEGSDDDLPDVSETYWNRTAEDLMHWRYEDVKTIVEGGPWCLYFDIADRRAAFFHELAEHWIFTKAPSQPVSQGPPKVLDDWIGSLALMEPKAEPILLHYEETPWWVEDAIKRIREGEEAHVIAGEILIDTNSEAPTDG